MLQGSLNIGGYIASSRVFLAPLAGITDLPFRRIARRFGAGLVVSEMIASGELLSGRAATAARAEIDDGCAAVQIAGREAAAMAECARRIEGMGAALIDMNFGCPAKKVTSGLSGSALMRDLDHATSLVEAVAGAVAVPVTVKMRLGWDPQTINAPQFAARAEAAGARMVTVHGRTRSQFYKGVADWAKIGRVRPAISVPLVANGDIFDRGSALAAAAAARSDAVMIGRAVRGAPWLPGRIADEIAGEAVAPEPIGHILSALVEEHYEAMLDFYGTPLGIKVARKHLGWYLARLDGSDGLRRQMMLMDDAKVVRQHIRMIGDFGPALAVAA